MRPNLAVAGTEADAMTRALTLHSWVPSIPVQCVQVDEICAEYDRDGGVADGQLTLDEFKVRACGL